MKNLLCLMTMLTLSSVVWAQPGDGAEKFRVYLGTTRQEHLPA